MKTLAIAIGLMVSLSANAGVAFLKGERVTGMTKQCFYDHLGSTYTITLSSVSLCPLTINI
jgi:hypothetical protein